MMNTAKKTCRLGRAVLAIVVMTILFYAAPNAGITAETPGVLDGKVFAVQTGKMGKEGSEKPDKLSFHEGKLHSADCDRWGFDKGVYTTKTEGDVVSFQAVTQSPKHGKIEWEGKVQGDTIEGTYHWEKQGWIRTQKQDKWFKGAMKK